MSSTTIRGKVSTGYGNVSRAGSDGNEMDLRCTRDAVPFTASWFMAQAMEGRMYHASAGSLTTPITWTATAACDMTKAAVMIDVPVGTTIIPVSISLYMEIYGTDALFECAAHIGSGGVSAGGTAVTVTNLRSDAPDSSLCTVTSDLTGGTALTTNISEFWRTGHQLVTTVATSDDASPWTPPLHVWRLAESGVIPIVKGAGQLFVTQGSQAGAGFCKICWVELPSTMIA